MENNYGNMVPNFGMQTNMAVPKKLWNPKGFIPISILFSFLPAAILYSLNYGRAGFPKKRNTSLALSFVAFIALISVAFLFDQEAVKAISYGINLGGAVYMSKKQSQLFQYHINCGGKKASFLVPVLVSVVIVAAVIFLTIFSSNLPDKKLSFKGSELYYTENVQKNEAQKLGEYLEEQDIFSEDHKISVKLDKQSNTYKFSVIVDKSSLENSESEQTMKVLAQMLSEDVFNNSKVDIVYCDKYFKPLKTISQ